jgi:thiol-disulfide isomerase/thioredoxin
MGPDDASTRFILRRRGAGRRRGAARIAVAATLALCAFAGAGTAGAKSPRRSTRSASFNVAKPYAAAEFAGLGPWVNTPAPVRLSGLRGKVVIVDFWTFGCVNCQRTLPRLRTLYAKYHAAGLEIVGIHSPEFGYERDAKNVVRAVREDRLDWPIALDNEFTTWNRYRNRYWPAFYFIDRQGRVRHVHAGEGQYANNEAVVAALLNEPASP